MERSLVWVNAEGLNEKIIQERMEWFQIGVHDRIKSRCDHEQDKISSLDEVGLVDMLNQRNIKEENKGYDQTQS